MNRIADHLTALYGSDAGRAALMRVLALIERYRTRIPAPRVTGLNERDAFLIAYGDQVRAPGEPPLQTLADFCARHVQDVISSVHLLPFFPFSSDDGFAVMDYRTVNPSLGGWDDVARIGEYFRLMFDAVVNHVSAQGEWFQRFLRDDPRYRDYFIIAPDDVDISRVIRPRTLPLLTRFETPSGPKNVWTTFSADQIDLNLHNPGVLLEIIDVLLTYVVRGAEFIRLDAIAFLWKEPGTTCLHLPQTHRIIQLLRAVLDEIAPHVALITETNVPHADNLSYFGDGANEAQLVYNFALPPLVLHAFRTGDARTLSRWASTLGLPSKRVTFFNFLASHDGIGLNPARGILAETEIDALVQCAQAHGGLVSFRNNPNGTTSPYELNINYFDALNDPNADEPLDVQVDRFMAAQAIMLSIVGVPGIYFHSLFGSRGWPEGARQMGQHRAINREKLELVKLERELADASSRRRKVFARYAQLLRARAAHPAFDPFGEMRALDLGKAVFAIVRGDRVVCLHNVSDQPCLVHLSSELVGPTGRWVDLLSGQPIDLFPTLGLSPYQTLWLALASEAD